MSCRHFLLGILGGAALALCAGPARGWSNKEHMQLTRLAAERLMADPRAPEAMKRWLKENTPDAMGMRGERKFFMTARIGIVPRGAGGLVYWSTMPDMQALIGQPSSKVEPFGVNERLLHYIDLECFMPDESRRHYQHDLSAKPALADIPRDLADPRWHEAGMLPFRIEDCYKQMVESLRAGRLSDRPGQYPRDDHATRWAGYLAHYLEDNTQPQHATLDYQARSYFADPENAPSIHSEVEYRMADDERDDYMSLRADYWPMLVKALEARHPPVEVRGGDLFTQTLEVSLASYDCLPLIGLAAMHASGQGGTPDHPQGPTVKFDTEAFYRFSAPVRGQPMSVMEMKAIQQAWAVQRVEEVWLRAWQEADEGKR